MPGEWTGDGEWAGGEAGGPGGRRRRRNESGGWASEGDEAEGGEGGARPSAFPEARRGKKSNVVVADAPAWKPTVPQETGYVLGQTVRRKRNRLNVATLMQKLLKTTKGVRGAPFPLKWTIAQVTNILNERELLLRNLVSTLLEYANVDFHPPPAAGGPDAVRRTPATSSRGASLSATSLLAPTPSALLQEEIASATEQSAPAASPDPSPGHRSGQAHAQPSPSPANEPFKAGLLSSSAEEWHRLDLFVSDYYQRKYGLPSLADKHVRTLLRCIRGHNTDTRVGMFARFMQRPSSLPPEQLLCFLCIRAICRTSGVPREAWGLIGQPVGGRARATALFSWGLIGACMVLR